MKIETLSAQARANRFADNGSLAQGVLRMTETEASGKSGADREAADNVVERARRGESAAIGTLFDRHHQSVFRYLWARLGDRQAAEDLTGEVFLRMQAALPRYEMRELPFRAWLFRIARNLLVDEYRRGKGRATVSLDEAAVASPVAVGPEQSAEGDLVVERLRRAIQRLSKARREVVALRFFGQLSLRETATALGKSVAAVKALQHEGLLALRDALREE